MKKSIFFYKELTPAEVGKTGTHEIYVRLPNNFDYETFFGNTAVENGPVLEVNFNAIDTTDDADNIVGLRYVYYKESNHEKRIPSLGELFKSHNVQDGDIVCLERREENLSVSYFIHFYKKGEIKINPNSVFFMRIGDEKIKKGASANNALPLQQIFYGAPGTGKSHEIKRQTKNMNVIRTTFHPDSDYSTFVGAYKPTMDDVDAKVVPIVLGESGTVFNKNEGTYKEKRITYHFVKQAFLKAYLGAWKKYADRDGDEAEPQFLVIEEINRGNCAQIFGDLFQLLDRGENKFSEYPIEADTDIQKEIERAFMEEKDGNDNNPYKLAKDIEIEGVVEGYISNYGATLSEDVQHGRVLLLPKNLDIWATMNTSDQSLFPIDSAFKRRWDWEYMPIEYKNENWTIKIGEKDYNWVDFQRKINDKIYSVDNSEDKQLGDYFVNANRTGNNISANTLLNKILFYIWNDVCKDDPDQIFQWRDDQDNNKEKSIKFSEFFCEEKERYRKLQGFMAFLKIDDKDVKVNVVQDNDTTTKENDDVVNS